MESCKEPEAFAYEGVFVSEKKPYNFFFLKAV